MWVILIETLCCASTICKLFLKEIAYLVPAGLKAIEKAAVISSIASYARYVQRNCKFHQMQWSETTIATQKL